MKGLTSGLYKTFPSSLFLIASFILSTSLGALPPSLLLLLIEITFSAALLTGRLGFVAGNCLKLLLTAIIVSPAIGASLLGPANNSSINTVNADKILFWDKVSSLGE